MVNSLWYDKLITISKLTAFCILCSMICNNFERNWDDQNWSKQPFLFYSEDTWLLLMDHKEKLCTHNRMPWVQQTHAVKIIMTNKCNINQYLIEISYIMNQAALNTLSDEIARLTIVFTAFSSKCMWTWSCLIQLLSVSHWVQVTFISLQ